MGEGGILAAIMGAGVAMIIVYLLIAVVLIVSYWKIYVKAGKPGWAAIVPISLLSHCFNSIDILELRKSPA